MGAIPRTEAAACQPRRFRLTRKEEVMRATRALGEPVVHLHVTVGSHLLTFGACLATRLVDP
jgi:hypothetical protein